MVVGHDADGARAEHRVRSQLRGNGDLDSRALTIRDGLGFVGERHDDRLRDSELVDDALDAADLTCKLFGALAIGLGAHLAVQRHDAIAGERAQIADVELLGEAYLHLEAELRVADFGGLAGLRSAGSAAGCVSSGVVRMRAAAQAASSNRQER